MSLLLLILVAGSAAFCLLAILAAEQYRSVKAPVRVDSPVEGISVLKPLHGLDEGLAENLQSFFAQDYPAFEILFAVEEESDPAVPVVKRLIAANSHIPARLVIAGTSPIPNAKVHSLSRMIEEARHDLIVMADSDVRVIPEFLRIVEAEMSGGNVALVTSPYRAVAGRSIWSQLEALGLNTEFISGVLVARMIGGMDFALGPAIATRKARIEEIGGFGELQQYLAEDFVMGNRLAQKGYQVVLSSYAIEHRIGSQGLGPNLSHRLRWNRSTRRSRPAGYIGQVFTHPLPIALLLWLWRPQWWPVALAAILIRYLAAWRASRTIQAEISYFRLPFQDLLSLTMWIAGFFGNEITWRTRRFTIDRLGRFQPSDSA